MKYSIVLALGVALVSAGPPPQSYGSKAPSYPSGCGYDTCLWKNKLPSKYKPLVTAFCKRLVGTPTASTTTVDATTTVTETITPDPVTETDVQTTVEVITESITCDTTVSTTATTVGTYPSFTPVTPSRQDKRDAAPPNAFEAALRRSGSYPDFVAAGCRKKPTIEKVKAACKCYLGTPPAVTVTREPETTSVTLDPTTVTVTDVTVTQSTTQTCTSTSTIFDTSEPISSCGAPAGVYASRTTGALPSCTQPVNAPSGSVNAFHRIEADDTQGTIFEGCIYSGPRSITTSSGGTHQCGADTGTTITGQMDAAAMLTGFTYDGTFSNSFNDYFISRIGTTQQSGNSFWGVLNNGVFTTSGGCGAQVRPGDRSLWQWDAFNNGRLLTITPEYAVVAPGSSVQITVTARSPNGGSSSPFGGATLSDASRSTSDASGNINFNAPTVPGCYKYKATASGQGRSNAFYLNVVASFPATIA